MSARALRLAAAVLLLCAVAVNAPAAPRERQGGAPAGVRVVVAGQVAMGKPTAPIAVTYEIGGTPALGQPVGVRIVAEAPAEMTDVTLELTADAALYLGPAVRASGAGATVRVWNVQVTPVQEGLGHLNVSVTGRLAGADQTRSLLIPIRTATAAGAAPAQTPTAAEAVISLPAQETR